jgi:murein DD-endopeptidase MepM/ murein hydrolase activator NlpD
VSKIFPKLKKINFRGFFKKPFFYFLLFSFILFILLLISLPKSKNLILGIDSKTTNRNPFLSSVGRFFLESPNLFFIQGNSLKTASPSTIVNPKVFGSLISESQETRKEILEYTVQEGDTLSKIVEKFGISLETILWANDLNKNSEISVGQKLIILPVSGVLHFVQKGETLSDIAKKYQADVEKIIEFNELENEKDIFAGDILVIPDGIMPPKTYIAPQIPLASSYFICPISQPCRITQGLHWYNAVDFSHGKCGEPIYAAAQGEVLKVKFGWNKGAGNYITILHPNGVITIYGHIATSFVNPGDKVYQGQIIALMGGQPGTPGSGISTGCHLHFGVQGAKNPFAQ